MAAQCCCGRYKPLDEPFIMNDTLHEPYEPGETEAFCGSVQAHELVALESQIATQAEEIATVRHELIRKTRELTAALAQSMSPSEELASLRDDKERLDWIEKNCVDVSFEGVEAERVPGGSTVKDYWYVNCGALVCPDGLTRELIFEAIGLRAAIDKAREG